MLDAFGPIQLEAEGKLYHKRLSLVHELELTSANGPEPDGEREAKVE